MDARDIVFSSLEFLRLIENSEIIGCWSWTFASDRHIWSNGFHFLLGLDVGTVRPSYALFLEFVHPDDRAVLESVAEIRQTGLLSSLEFRLIRPDGSLRVLSARNEVFFNPDGRPRAAAGVVLDVTDRERLRQLRQLEQKRRHALFHQARIMMFSLDLQGDVTYPQGGLDLMGLSADEAFRLGLTQIITARHIRAARALLDWSREELANAAGLSLSTIRRVEGRATRPNDASTRRIVQACEGAGLRFDVLSTGAIAVSAR